MAAPDPQASLPLSANPCAIQCNHLALNHLILLPKTLSRPAVVLTLSLPGTAALGRDLGRARHRLEGDRRVVGALEPKGMSEISQRIR